MALLAKLKGRVRWAAYIAAMRGIMTSRTPDPNLIDAQISHLQAEERFFADRKEHQ